ncbi:Phosphoserine transaminase [Elusimicrobium minutum Pei191]|uniref:phosphoserine transaminase n=1 Tax=Elusimicrobium minutum (strain Pei191) TaxID=445932 RepID=B2KCM0_ELUMP|nr:aminotransferase class V-fold PLP-dependent enzyme [Elusimicrobium minutum]ACC98266.1 Phosphoserine transaminase [Elusimicrobium minutum Pei191]
MNIPNEILPDVTFACGPSQGHPDFRNTPLSETYFEKSHRSALLSQGLYKEATENIKNLLQIPQDYELFFFHGGATPAMDAIVWNLTKNSISGLSFGAFSKLWAKKIAGALPSDIKKDFKSPAEGEYFPKEKADYKASLVILTPNETSMGVQISNKYLEEAWAQKGEDTIIAWDCTSCAGGRLLPSGKFDVMLFSLQKCFGAPGGTSVIILSPKAVKRAEEIKASGRNIPYILQFEEALAKVKKYQTVNTPSTTNIWLANEAAKWMLANGGLKAMDELCRKHAKAVLDFAAKTDYLEPLIKDEDNRSYTTLTLKITDSKLKDADISSAIKKCGKGCLSDGISKYSSVEDNSLRIACFPFVDINGTEQFEKLAKTIDFVVKELRK